MILFFRLFRPNLALITRKSVELHLRKIASVHYSSRLCQKEEQQRQNSKDSRKTTTDNNNSNYNNVGADNSVVESKSDKSVTDNVVVEKVKKFSYASVFALGIAVLLGLFYVVGAELFGKSSLTKIQHKTFEYLKDNEEIQGILGEPLACYGLSRLTRRRSSQPVYFIHAQNDGSIGLQMTFMISGPKGQGQVNVHVNDYKTNNRISSILFKPSIKHGRTIQIL